MVLRIQEQGYGNRKKNLLRTRFEEHLKLEAYFLMPVHIQEAWKYILSLNRKGDRIISYFWDLPSCNSECKTEMILKPGCNLRKFFSSVKFTCSCIIGKILLVCLAVRELPCISENLFPLTILWRFCHSYADIIIEDPLQKIGTTIGRHYTENERIRTLSLKWNVSIKFLTLELRESWGRGGRNSVRTRRYRRH